jgi:hypothetical protein
MLTFNVLQWSANDVILYSLNRGQLITFKVVNRLAPLAIMAMHLSLMLWHSLRSIISSDGQFWMSFSMPCSVTWQERLNSQ